MTPPKTQNPTHQRRTTRAAAIATSMALTSTALASIMLSGCAATPKPPAPTERRIGGAAVTEFEPAQRGKPVTLQGTDTTGKTINSADLRGKVIIVNLWYAACGPCRAEAPALKSVTDDLAKDGVTGLGLNTRDSAATAAAFEKKFEINYPTIVDNDGKAVAELTKYISARAVPVSVILDQQGRVAARNIGIVNESNLRTMVKKVLAEQQ